MNITHSQRRSAGRGKRQDKGTLLVEKVEQFTLLNRANLKEAAKLKEFFYTLVNHASKEQRRKMSIALARDLYAPRSILIFLALESVDIASPVLLFSQTLSEFDLRSIISKTTIEHRRVIARRDNLEAETIHNLLECDDENETILKILKQNNSVSAILEDVERSRKQGYGSQKMEKIEALISASETTHTNEFPIPSKDITDRLLTLANIGGKLQSNTRRKETKSYSAENTATDLIIAARQSQHETIVDLVFKNTNLSPEHTLGYIKDGDVGTFACLLYAMNIERIKATRILLLLYPQTGKSSQQLKKVMACYDAIEHATAVDFFKSIDSEFTAPVISRNTTAQADQFNRLIQNRRNAILDQSPQIQPEEAEAFKIRA